MKQAARCTAKRSRFRCVKPRDHRGQHLALTPSWQLFVWRDTASVKVSKKVRPIR